MHCGGLGVHQRTFSDGRIVEKSRAGDGTCRCCAHNIKENLVAEGKRRVLVVEDDHQARDLLTLLLEDAGYRVHAVGNPVEALEQMKRSQFEVVVIDYHMPRLNGLEFMTISHIVWPRTPVVLVSGDQPEPSSLVVRRGASAWIPKPYDHALLLRTIHVAAQRSLGG
jgi:CheY-like chemotaxis protein